MDRRLQQLAHGTEVKGRVPPAPPILGMPPILQLDTKGRFHDLVIALAVALTLRAALGYRPFPSIDDFEYIPLAWSRLDSTLYARDFIVQHFVLHVPLQPVLVGLLQETVGLAPGYWAVTLFLTFLSVWALARLINAAGGSLMALPLASLLAFAGVVKGLGRGSLDGALGNGFHMQWAALCMLLWTYVAIVRLRPMLAGCGLGATLLIHPMVGAHGVFVAAVATALLQEWRWKRWIQMNGIVVLLSAPIAAFLLYQSLVAGTASGAAPIDVVEQGYLFRVPQEFVVEKLSAVICFAVGACGIAAAAYVRRVAPGPGPSALFALLTAHLLLALLAVGIYGPAHEAGWTAGASFLFTLHLTRTTPLVLVLAGASVGAAVATAHARSVAAGEEAWFWILLGVALILLLAVGIAWQPLYLLLFGAMTAAAILGSRPGGGAWRLVIWGSIAAVALVHLCRNLQLEWVPPAEEQALYDWAKSKTAKDSLFIIPPGFMAFRLEAQRAVYVDFKIFPVAPSELTSLWKQRLDEIALPDGIARHTSNYGIVEWDRTYANRNTPSRITALLGRTGADYFVWDRNGLAAPPFVEVPRVAHPALGVAFENPRFTVYTLRESSPR
jgi:hypothetical protein